MKSLGNYFKVNSFSKFQSLALLLLRLIMGVAFILHGWGKIQSPFNWMPGADVPGVFQFLAAVSEFGGGIALIFGLFVPLFMLGLAFTMAVATHFHMIIKGDPFVNTKGGGSYELALVYLGVSLLFMALGPGRYSLDKIIFGERSIFSPKNSSL